MKPWSWNLKIRIHFLFLPALYLSDYESSLNKRAFPAVPIFSQVDLIFEKVVLRMISPRILKLIKQMCKLMVLSLKTFSSYYWKQLVIHKCAKFWYNHVSGIEVKIHVYRIWLTGFTYISKKAHVSCKWYRRNCWWPNHLCCKNYCSGVITYAEV